ncbi:site-specific integrase [Dysgonomonas sp. 511]|uniref:site-specific integrase n=1 Tax=Dysgonomonas sp. 511 TaxID=2302930 RepID=UPI0013D2537C|nr:site-specific integrase [Dysgonomonas sp. 511]NDV80102.1 site-specific integrase [Dysgonomonas sp. 511]
MVNILCYKSKTLANGEHPLVIRICKDGKKKYQSLGISINPKYWDFDKNQPKRNCPNKEQILQLITERSKEYTEQIIELKTIKRDFTAKSLFEKVNGATKLKTVQSLFDIQIQRLISANRLKYALTYKDLMNSLIKFNQHLDIYFSDIDITWLKKYETWLRGCNLKENTIGIRFRTLRALYNLAIEENVVKSEYYPFDNYKVSKLKQKTAKRSIVKDDIMAIINYQSFDKEIQFAVDLFTFSYFMGGINFVDISRLTSKNIEDGYLCYIRKKTKRLIKLPLQERAIELIHKYTNPQNPYLFPILNNYHKTEQQKANRVHKIIGKVNKRLKDIGKELNIPIDLTTYVARHSFATVLKRSGVNTSIISESLGHSSEKVTQIYLDSFENSQIDEAMKNLL